MYVSGSRLFLFYKIRVGLSSISDGSFNDTFYYHMALFINPAICPRYPLLTDESVQYDNFTIYILVRVYWYIQPNTSGKSKWLGAKETPRWESWLPIQFICGSICRVAQNLPLLTIYIRFTLNLNDVHDTVIFARQHLISLDKTPWLWWQVEEQLYLDMLNIPFKS